MRLCHILNPLVINCNTDVNGRTRLGMKKHVSKWPKYHFEGCKSTVSRFWLNDAESEGLSLSGQAVSGESLNSVGQQSTNVDQRVNATRWSLHIAGKQYSRDTFPRQCELSHISKAAPYHTPQHFKACETNQPPASRSWAVQTELSRQAPLLGR